MLSWSVGLIDSVGQKTILFYIFRCFYLNMVPLMRSVQLHRLRIGFFQKCVTRHSKLAFRKIAPGSVAVAGVGKLPSLCERVTGTVHCRPAHPWPRHQVQANSARRHHFHLLISIIEVAGDRKNRGDTRATNSVQEAQMSPIAIPPERQSKRAKRQSSSSRSWNAVGARLAGNVRSIDIWRRSLISTLNRRASVMAVSGQSDGSVGSV